MDSVVYFFCSKEIGRECLKFLLDNQDKYSIKIKAVFTNNRMLNKKSLSIRELCERNKIKVYDSQNALSELPNPDYLISIQYHEIIKKKYLEKVKFCPINLHMAPLPKYRGCNQFSFAIFNKEKIFGTTLHFMDSNIDNGDILFQKKFRIKADFVFELYDQTFKESYELFSENIEKYFNGDFKARSQSSYKDKPSFYLRSDIERIKAITNDMNIEEKKRRFKATYFPPFSPPFLVTKEGRIPLDMKWFRDLKD